MSFDAWLSVWYCLFGLLQKFATFFASVCEARLRLCVYVVGLQISKCTISDQNPNSVKQISGELRKNVCADWHLCSIVLLLFNAFGQYNVLFVFLGFSTHPKSEVLYVVMIFCFFCAPDNPTSTVKLFVAALRFFDLFVFLCSSIDHIDFWTAFIVL